MARFIRIVTSRTVTFTVTVTEARPNVALKKPTKVYLWSTSEWSSVGDNAVDGDYNTFTHPPSLLNSISYWRVDLKDLITIDKIILYLNRRYYTTGMTVYTNRWALNSWTLCKTVGEDLGPAGHDEVVPIEVTCAKTTIARHVIVIDTAFRLYEMEIYEDAVWFKPPYDCFDTATPQFGCKDLTFDLSTGTVKKERWTGRKTHEEAGAEEAERRKAEHQVYYKIKSKMMAGPLYAGLDSSTNAKSTRQRYARVLSETTDANDGELSTIYGTGDSLLWELVKEENVHGTDYYKIISKDTNGPMYANLAQIPSDTTNRYVKVKKGNHPPTHDKQLWELVKRDDAYYTIVSKYDKTPLFSGPNDKYFGKVKGRNQDKYREDGQGIWDIEKT